MNLIEIISNLNNIFANEGIDINLNASAYDAALIESTPRTEIVRWSNDEKQQANLEIPNGILDSTIDSRIHGSNSRFNRQTHFFISSTSRPLFIPFIQDTILDKYSLCYPFELREKNIELLLNHLSPGYYSPARVTHLLSKYNSDTTHELYLSVKPTGNRIMFASKANILPNNLREFYLENRYAIFEGDYLVILKYKNQMRFELLFIPAPAVVAAGVNFSHPIDGQLIGVPSAAYNLIQNMNRTGAKNLLVFGAPGTGKSFWVKNNFEMTTNSIRVTFHEEYSYQDFVGSLKPSSTSGNITYPFKPGPFTKILVLALNNPTESYSLIIEEINRANAASVFGDLFQLLDRDQDGLSEYGIEQEEMINYIIKEIPNYSEREIKLPTNLNIIATMNSADQGVFPLDMAFKRRWHYEYIPIAFENWHSSEQFIYFNDDSSTPSVNKKISIKDFIEEINNYISTHGSLEINEDRLVGPYFLKQHEWTTLHEAENYKKILAYLWDDVARVERNSLFTLGYTQFQQICADFSLHKQIFTDELHEKLLAKCIDVP